MGTVLEGKKGIGNVKMFQKMDDFIYLQYFRIFFMTKFQRIWLFIEKPGKVFQFHI